MQQEGAPPYIERPGDLAGGLAGPDLGFAVMGLKSPLTQETIERPALAQALVDLVERDPIRDKSERDRVDRIDDRAPVRRPGSSDHQDLLARGQHEQAFLLGAAAADARELASRSGRPARGRDKVRHPRVDVQGVSDPGHVTDNERAGALAAAQQALRFEVRDGGADCRPAHLEATGELRFRLQLAAGREVRSRDDLEQFSCHRGGQATARSRPRDVLGRRRLHGGIVSPYNWLVPNSSYNWLSPYSTLLDQRAPGSGRPQSTVGGSVMVAAGKLIYPQGMLIDGQWRPSASGAVLPVHDPATGEQIASIPAGGAADVAAAVESAQKSFKAGNWSRIAPSERGRILWRLAQLIRENTEDLAYTETRDFGKPIAELIEDMGGSADCFEYYAGACTKIIGQTLPLPNGQYGFVLREPVGVVGLITPWNFPLYIAAWKGAPALAAGCSVVLKPPSLSSLTCLALADLALQAGVPAGVFNVVTGKGTEAGEALAKDPRLDVLAFTGGTDTGKRVMALSAEMVRPVQLELGGKSPDIVFDDADMETAVAGAAFGIFYTQGENCNAGSRLLVQRRIYEEFLRRLGDFANKIRLLPPLDERSQIGSLVSQEQLDKVEYYVGVGLSQGARLICGGKRATEGEFAKGFFYPPTVLADVKPTDRVFQEEIFGPVLTVTPFDTVDEGIELANGTAFGLAAGAWTASAERAMKCVQELKSGYVWINTLQRHARSRYPSAASRCLASAATAACRRSTRTHRGRASYGRPPRTRTGTRSDVSTH